jgi:hypothetical protein
LDKRKSRQKAALPGGLLTASLPYWRFGVSPVRCRSIAPALEQANVYLVPGIFAGRIKTA